ncbi:MAG: CoA transferase [Chloroflexi bacterium]|nr:CoA transferase [Chloroflexota bacterium]
MTLNMTKAKPTSRRKQKLVLPLTGVRVADFSWLLAGPLATRYLASLGAEVIRLETRKRLDQLRNLGPFADGVTGPNRSPHFNNMNYSKLSCTLDLTDPRAAALARRLVEVSDVVVQNFAAGVMERFGLGWEELRRERPDLIYVSGSGMGSTGPYKDYVAYGMTLHAFSGVTYTTGYPGGPPKPLSGTWADPVTAHTMAYAILAALHYRRRTGQGQHIDLAMSEAMLAITPEPVLECSITGRTLERRGNFEELMVPHNTYRCQGDDAWVAIAVGSEADWRALCRAAGHPEWATDPRFADAYARRANETEMDQLIASWTAEHTPEEVARTLQRAGVAAYPCLPTIGVIQDPQLKARGFLVPLEHPEVGTRPVFGQPWYMSGVKEPCYRHAPLIGQHTAYALQEVLGLPPDEVRRLAEEKVTY